MSPPDPSKKDVKVPGGAVIITGIDRFFSNGLDYVNANKNKRFFEGESSLRLSDSEGELKADEQMSTTLSFTG